MLDNIISCGKCFKRMSDCKVNSLGVQSNHAAIMTQFRLTAIKFNNDRDDITIIDWQKYRQRERKILSLIPSYSTEHF